jgi:hypothetical protein
MNNYESAYNIPDGKKTKTKHIMARKQGTPVCDSLKNRGFQSSLWGGEDDQQFGQ